LEVYALVGASGTGKSHRAVLLAYQTGAEVIIDDGLIIKGNQIVAGISAKKQPTRIGAIKTALFNEQEQMEAARKAIRELAPGRLLILGTSGRMIDKIAHRLDLPGITKYISIDEIASPKEIRKARTMRSQHSKHVIPAPAVEVRKTFPESIINPLQVFMRRKGHRGNKSWLEQSVVRPTFTMYGKLTISRGALKSIVTRAAITVAGVAEVKKVGIDRNENEVNIEIEILAGMKIQINNVSREVQVYVKEQVEHMAGLTVKQVNVTVAGIAVGEIV